METNTYLEKEFNNYLYNKGRISVLSGTRKQTITLIKREVILFEPYSLFSRDFDENLNTFFATKRGAKSIIGKIDLLFRHNSKLYCGEIKFRKKYRKASMNDFYDATKVLAYTEYYNWQNETWGGFDPAEPAILIPKYNITLATKIMANRLRVRLYAIIKDDNGFVLELLAGY